MELSYLKRLLELLEKLQSAYLKKDYTEADALRQQIERHIGSLEEFVDALRNCQGKYGCRNDHSVRAIECAASAQRKRGGGGIYPALWFDFAHESFLSELTRWINGASGKKPARPGQKDKARATNLTVGGIDRLLELSRQLKTACEPILPQEEREKLGKSSLRKARKELSKEREDKIEVLKRKHAQGAAASGLGSSYGSSSGRTTKPQADVPEPTQTEITLRAWQIYQERVAKSPDHQQAVADAKAKKDVILKEIDHSLYPISEEIMKFSKAKGTLLDADYLSQIRGGACLDVKVVDETIDAPEAIRVKVEREQQGPAPARTEQRVRRIIVGLGISLTLIVVFELLVHIGPLTWFKNHPNSYGIQGGIIFLILSFVMGLFKSNWRKWCWGTAGLALLALILSLLGGRSH